MIDNYIKLIFGTFLGSLTTFLNISVAKIPTNNQFDLHDIVDISQGCFGLITAVFTCVYFYYQIRKIRKDSKSKK